MTTPLARATACGMGTGPAPMSKTGSDGRIESSGSSFGSESKARTGGVLLGATGAREYSVPEEPPARRASEAYAGPLGGVATWPIGIRHEERSKIMNSSAFSCGVNGCMEHSPGTTPPVIDPINSG